jgi:16S rRNA (uracil1498-N3)-methyltransferase
MRIPRIYTPSPLHSGATIELDENAFNHAVRVLRLSEKSSLILFNGAGGEYEAVLCDVQKKRASATLGAYSNRECESPLPIILGQCISRGEKMDYTIQKAVELGVTEIAPLFSERCGVRLDQERSDKRMQHWQSTIISACEQSGRNRLPLPHSPTSLEQWFNNIEASCKLVLDPTASSSLAQLPKPEKNVALLIGPEGGLSDVEIEGAIKSGFTAIRLGPRILRTETAGLVVLSSVQQLWGDLGV